MERTFLRSYKMWCNKFCMLTQTGKSTQALSYMIPVSFVLLEHANYGTCELMWEFVISYVRGWSLPHAAVPIVSAGMSAGACSARASYEFSPVLPSHTSISIAHWFKEFFGRIRFNSWGDICQQYFHHSTRALLACMAPQYRLLWKLGPHF